MIGYEEEDDEDGDTGIIGPIRVCCSIDDIEFKDFKWICKNCGKICGIFNDF